MSRFDWTDLGTVVHGTLLPGDLMDAFFSELEYRDPVFADELRPDFERLIEEPDTQEGLDFLYEDLMGALNDLAPDGYYFGAHPGDGADFGWWPIEEDVEDGDYIAERVAQREDEPPAPHEGFRDAADATRAFFDD